GPTVNTSEEARLALADGVVCASWRKSFRLGLRAIGRFDTRGTHQGGADMAEKMVLNEDEALELVAFLVTAAPTQVDEAAEYGSLRLLTAASRRGELVVERVSPETRPGQVADDNVGELSPPATSN